MIPQSRSSLIRSWNLPKLNFKFAKQTKESAEAVEAKTDFHRYFDCELQSLDDFLDNPDVYDYFGCSKLSCFFCWEICKGTPCQTKDSHVEVYPACAFPFPLFKGNGRYNLILALKKVQDYLLKKVLRRALDPEYEFTGNSIIAETLRSSAREELDH